MMHDSYARYEIGNLSKIIVSAAGYGIKGDLYSSGYYYDARTLNSNPTDNTTALQNLLNSVYQSGGGTVYLPPGVYMISNTILIPPMVRLVGSGVANTIIQWHPSNINTYGPMIRIPYSQYAGLKDLMIYGCCPNSPTSDLYNSNAIGLLIDNDSTAYPSVTNGNSSNFLDINNISIQNFYGNGLENHTYAAWVYNVHDVEISNCCGWGLKITQTDNQYSNINIYNCQKGAANITGHNNILIGGKWFFCGQFADSASSFASAVIITGKRNQLTGVQIQDNYKNGVVLYNDELTTLTNIVIDSCGRKPDGTQDTSTISYPNSTTDQVGIALVCYGSNSSNLQGVSLGNYRYYDSPSHLTYKTIKLYSAKINLSGSQVSPQFTNSAIDSDSYSTTNSKINWLT